MTDRIYSRKEVLAPGVDLPKEVVSAAKLPCVGVALRSTPEGPSWIVEVDVCTANQLQSSLTQRNQLEKEKQAAMHQVIRLRAEAEAEHAHYRQKLGDLRRRLRETERLCEELALGNAHLLKKADDAAREGPGPRRPKSHANVDDLQLRLVESYRRCKQLEQNNAQLLKNINDPTLEGRGPRSPKNYLEVAKERHTNFGRPGTQGGDGGLQKK